jgi:hypothetical protein
MLTKIGLVDSATFFTYCHAHEKRPPDKFLPPGHPKVNKGKIGVLLMNLGTPEATSYWPMRRYLKEFCRTGG